MADAGDRLPQERRKDRRVSLVQDIECDGGAGKFRKRLADMSAGGMFIDSLTSFSGGEVVRIRFCMPDSDDPIHITAKVVYVQERIGSGMQFLDLKPEDRERIQDLVDAVSAKKKPAGAELGISSRVLVKIPVTLGGTEAGGESFEEESNILTLAKNGGSLRTHRHVEVGGLISLILPNGSRFEARVVWAGAEEIGIRCRGLAQVLGFDFP